jgi:DNA-binding response OmpR family regulator
MATKKVLVVDDQADMRKLIRAMLETDRSDNFLVVEAASGTDCLKAADRSGPFDLILLDVTLPDMEGYAVCRAIRSVDANVPIVFVTGRGDLKDYAAGRQAGGDSYLVKPFGKNSLRSLVSLFTSLQRGDGQKKKS